MSQQTHRVLGLDIGNAKVKVLYLETADNTAEQIHWDSLPLPMSPNRATDFQVYLPLQILQFLKAHAIQRDTLDQVVICCSHSFGYDPYSESIRHLQKIFATFFGDTPVALVRCDGELTPLQTIDTLSDRALYSYVFTNFYGSAWLGKHLIQNGLSLDMGTTTLDIIPIQKGQIDPQGLHAPEDYLRFRYHQNRIHWLGMTVTPLEALAERVTCNGQSYQIVPRGYSTESLFAKDPRKTLLAQHAYGKSFPESQRARRNLCESIGLDNALLTDAEVEELRQGYYQAMIQKVTNAIDQVTEKEFKDQPRHDLELAVFALGAESVLLPALEKAGFNPERIKTLHYGYDKSLWSASSVFSMALQALEKTGGSLNWTD